jgi:serine palmitoyltransferase
MTQKVACAYSDSFSMAATSRSLAFGHDNSPIIPPLTFNPDRMLLLSRLVKERKVSIVVVTVGHPAAPLVTSTFLPERGATNGNVDELLRACDEAGKILDHKWNVADTGR